MRRTVIGLLVLLVSIARMSEAQTCADRLAAIRSGVVSEQSQVTSEKSQVSALLNKKATSALLNPITSAQTTTVTTQASTVSALDALAAAGCLAPPPPAPLVLTPVAGQTFQSPDGQPVAVTYVQPTPSGGAPPYGPVTCNPIEASLFDVGTSGIVCSITDSLGASATTGVGSSPPFSITVTVASLPPPLGVWTNVTPPGVDVSGDTVNGCWHIGATSVVADPSAAGTFYATIECHGVWKSVDYGLTWVAVNAISGGQLAAAPGALYIGGIRDSALGFWKSVNGGLSWTRYTVGPAAPDRQDVYPPSVDPYDATHLIMAGHEQNLLVQSTDGGQTWTSISLASGMLQNGGTAYLFFINTGAASTTRTTWLYSAQGSAGQVGTWRTTNAGASWTRVESAEHPHGDMQIFQPDASGLVFMGQIYSGLGNGVLRSTDYGRTWTHVGSTDNSGTVFGTPNRVQAWYGCGSCDPLYQGYQTAPMPGLTGWVSSTVAGMAGGPAMGAVVPLGVNWVIVSANWTGGLWRYVE